MRRSCAAGSWTGPEAQTREYAYDYAGNRLWQSINAAASGGGYTYTTYGYDRQNRLTGSDHYAGAWPNQTQTGSALYQYDDNGNRTYRDVSDNGVWTRTWYVYDVSNRLIQVDQQVEDQGPAQTIFTATYDARTRRLTKTENGGTTLFRYDGGVSFQEWRYGEIYSEIIRAGGLGGGIGSVLYTDYTVSGDPQPLPISHFAYDANGNVLALTNYAKAVVQATRYEAFGQVISQGMNVYVSVGNNPINWIDPLGLSKATAASTLVPKLQRLWRATKGAGMVQVHHIITQSTFRQYGDDLATLGFNVGDRRNLISLPTPAGK